MAWRPERVSASRDNAVEPVDGVFVNGGFFAAMRLPVGLGRPLEPSDDRNGAPPVVVISHGYWQRQFGGAADVIGRTILVDETSFAVVGVTPPAFTGLEIGQAADLILPLSALDRGPQSNLRPPFDAMNMWLRIGVRLRSDLVSALFFGVSPWDPLLLMLASAALVGTALLAAWIPARRAHEVNPSGILRAS